MACEPVNATTAEGAIRRILTADVLQECWFSPAFLAHVRLPELSAFLTRNRIDHGRFVRARSRDDDSVVVEFERGQCVASITIEKNGRIERLLFPPITLLRSDLQGILADLPAYGRQCSYLILRDGDTLAQREPDTPMAVGSSFKLAVLAAIQEALEGRVVAADSILRLHAVQKSLPSGLLQEWPEGTPLTVATCVALMGAYSDNTAADMLMCLIGRETLEELSPRNRPFLTTREMFALRSRSCERVRQQYLVADVAQKRAILEALPTGQLRADDVDVVHPQARAIEYFFTVRELCDLMKRVSDEPSLSIVPQFSLDGWKSIAYKGGSNAGVLNFTIHGESGHGNLFTASVTWNDPDRIDAVVAAKAVASALAQLAQAV